MRNSLSRITYHVLRFTLYVFLPFFVASGISNPPNCTCKTFIITGIYRQANFIDINRSFRDNIGLNTPRH
jgi:hypothetical protein